MAIFPHEIKVTAERPQVAIMDVNGEGCPERLGFFHKWSERNGEDYALVETVEGIMEYVPATSIRFLPIGHETPLPDLESVYYETKILKG